MRKIDLVGKDMRPRQQKVPCLTLFNQSFGGAQSAVFALLVCRPAYNLQYVFGLITALPLVNSPEIDQATMFHTLPYALLSVDWA